VLGDGGPLTLAYLPERRMRIRGLRHLTDASGRPAGLRFAYFLARELAHDFFRPKRKRSIRDWGTLAVGLLTSVGAIASLVLKVDRTFSERKKLMNGLQGGWEPLITCLRCPETQ
jgi:hypothetical protein